MNGQPVELVRVSPTSPKQKRMIIYVAKPVAPLIKTAKIIARGTLREGFWTSSAVVEWFSARNTVVIAWIYPYDTVRRNQ